MNKEAYYRRALAAICNACGYAPAQIPLLLRWWWSSWRHHPDYDEQTDDLFKVPVAGVWQHAPGLEQRVHSYIFGLPQDVLSSLSWGKRCFGDNFHGLYPIPPWIPIGSPYICSQNNSFRGANGAYYCRMTLKKLLPTDLRPLITLARWANRRSRKVLAGIGNEEEAKRTPKWQVFFDHKVDPAKRRQLVKLIDEQSFWRIATGKVNPYEVEAMLLDYQRRYLQQFARQPIVDASSALPGKNGDQLPLWAQIEREIVVPMHLRIQRPAVARPMLALDV